MRPAGRLAEANIPATTLLSGPAEAEHHLGDAPHLDLFRPFRNPVTPVVPVDVLEGHMPRVADAAVHLDRLVRRVTDQPVRAVVAHRHLVADLHVVLMVQLPGVFRTSWRTISHSVCSSTSGHWMAWRLASGCPNVTRSC